ncbi:hypothetical protein SS50377_27312 [Spironucleus salmonicida]|uniref:Uncharacterized protein n=1 Tax=Spironucleus salmonicida TaxID=348837 RepID=V6LFV8_9EUKA|nr:hypothetical protein SS50377_27306 [Spironucleus salmonicida]KAH0571018.1 hypothetical protein SS50377_27312 [Spironucleus salmonicida]|eukprot:EST43392.1 Hypothetical protein SS50377_17073 [Spironucleus salmonicida]
MAMIGQLQDAVRAVPSSYFTASPRFGEYVADYLQLQLALYRAPADPAALAALLRRLLPYQAPGAYTAALSDAAAQLESLHEFRALAESACFERGPLLARKAQLEECAFLADRELDRLQQRTQVAPAPELLLLWRCFLGGLFVASLASFRRMAQ